MTQILVRIKCTTSVANLRGGHEETPVNYRTCAHILNTSHLQNLCSHTKHQSVTEPVVFTYCCLFLSCYCTDNHAYSIRQQEFHQVKRKAVWGGFTDIFRQKREQLLLDIITSSFMIPAAEAERIPAIGWRHFVLCCRASPTWRESASWLWTRKASPSCTETHMLVFTWLFVLSRFLFFFSIQWSPSCTETHMLIFTWLFVLRRFLFYILHRDAHVNIHLAFCLA